MKSDTITVEQLFQNRRQYCVPFYQRAYVWTLEDQWEQLWEDIQAKAEARLENRKCTPHFLGAVVLDPQQRDGLIGVEAYHIIDGQQRLTTLQYVLTSALFAVNDAKDSPLSPIIAGCLKNGNPETMCDPAVETFKVWPTFRDRSSYRSALTAANLGELAARFQPHYTQAGELRKIGMEHPASLAAIWYFTHQFQDWLAEGDGESSMKRAQALVLAVLRDLKLVSIVLEADDDAQIIFETLNGRGAQLHATDLIRNFVFMRADLDKRADPEQADSESLYDNLWSSFEAPYWSEEQRRGRMKKPRLEWLIHATLQAELHEDVDLARIYHEYRRFATSGSTQRNAEQQLVTLNSYAVYYKELVSGTGTTPVAQFGRRITDYDITTLYPLALMIAASPSADAEKTEMYTDLVSYLVRRAVCWLTSKNYNNVFQGLLKQLYTNGINPAALRTLLKTSTSDVSRWPDDAEFRNACLNAALYPGRLDSAKMKSMLAELEVGLRASCHPEEVLASGLEMLDVDHILPQSWFAYWPLADGSTATRDEVSEVEILSRSGLPLNERQQSITQREAACRSLGNLTLLNLSVNRKAQNYGFTEKRNLLIANTSLRLNIPLVGRSDWNETAIAERGKELVNLALRIWPGPRT